ncbi:unnamed protein product [Lupinus luteus]|uniref:Uncharacterized protein n=1 Tax=Lupinus luteus TaxID=3873 RepID=A0AAV1WZN3_LUPLU
MAEAETHKLDQETRILVLKIETGNEWEIVEENVKPLKSETDNHLNTDISIDMNSNEIACNLNSTDTLQFGDELPLLSDSFAEILAHHLLLVDKLKVKQMKFHRKLKHVQTQRKIFGVMFAATVAVVGAATDASKRVSAAIA